jgi:hypothetical protein
MRRHETVLARIGELPRTHAPAALAFTLGGEAIITIKDVCRLDASRPSPSYAGQPQHSWAPRSRCPRLRSRQQAEQS